MAEVYHALGLHLHQPLGNLVALHNSGESREARQILWCYDRPTRMLEGYEDVARLHLSFSGTLLKQLEDPGVRQTFGDIVNIEEFLNRYRRSNIEFLGSGLYHPVYPLVPPADRDAVDRGAENFMIWVGVSEGESIRRAMDSSVTPRPMSHHLIKNLGEHLGIKTERVVLTDVKSSTYFATVYLENKGVTRTIGARPSDAIALALRCQAPIYSAQDVWRRRSGQNLDAWLSKLETKNIGAQEV